MIRIREWISEGSKEEARMPRGQERKRSPRGACSPGTMGDALPHITALAIFAHGAGVWTTESPSVALVWSQTGGGRNEDWIAPQKDQWHGL